jgi:hypothetical protein
MKNRRIRSAARAFLIRLRNDPLYQVRDENEGSRKTIRIFIGVFCLARADSFIVQWYHGEKWAETKGGQKSVKIWEEERECEFRSRMEETNHLPLPKAA